MKNMSFYISNPYFISKEEEIDLSRVPASLKRRLSKIDKVAMSLFLKTDDYNFDEIVFSSEYGELERLKLIIEQYTAYNEVSPMQFTGSVHNFPVGSFCLTNKINHPYSSVSAGSNSISTGILQALMSKKQKVLFCYADFKDSPKGFVCLLTKTNHNGIECVFEDKRTLNTNNEFDELQSFFTDKSDFVSSLFTIKRS